MAIYTQDEWKPLTIMLQIITNQCWFYAIWMSFHSIATYVLNMPSNLSISFFFTDNEFNLVDIHFYLITVELVLTCLVMVPIIVFIAERAKKCFDFCSTIFIIHFIVCVCFYVGIPLNFYWWGIMILCMTGMTLLSERISVKRELEDILVEDILENV